jgi:hypothetical protein
MSGGCASQGEPGTHRGRAVPGGGERLVQVKYLGDPQK